MNRFRKQKTLDDSSIGISTKKYQHLKLLERRGSLDTITRKLNLSFRYKNKSRDGELLNESGLVGNAIKSILMEPLKLADEIEEQIKKSSLEIDEDIDKNQKEENNNIKIETKVQNEDESKNNKWDPSSSSLSLNKKSHPIIVIHEDISFYSSEPELKESSLSPSDLKVPPFTSLTNLNSTTSTSSLLCPMLNNQMNIANNNCVSASTSPYSSITTLNPNSLQYPSPTTSPIDISPTKMNSFHSLNVNLKNARNNILLSSSDTNLLSTTNKAQTLTPFPYLKQHRSELTTTPSTVTVAMATASNQINTIGINTSTSSSGKTIIPNNGHNRAESMSGCKLSQSPAKIGNSAPIGTIGNKEKDKDTAIYRRSSDSDLSVTPKGM